MQSLYSISHQGNQSLVHQTAFYTESVKKSFDLYYLLMATFKSIYTYAEKNIELEKKLQYELPTSLAEKILLNPYFKFLNDHKTISDYIKKRKINNWNLDSEYIHQFYVDLTSKPLFSDYSPGLNNNADSVFCVEFFKDCVAKSDKLYDYLEDKQLTWIDDFPVTNTYILKQIKAIDLEGSKQITFPSFNIESEEIVFGINILKEVITKSELLESEIKGKTPNWDSDRIADIDFILLKMAISELLYFNEIPVRVTINEYLEIAKDYSTPKSNIFINGVLDKISKDFDQNGRLNKEGRGLL
ncbi:transcription antitermination factor NusB [Flavobacteriaceae bacterium]|nr:transcription antitermination factor NusB [Flavobacteriaceae bacterium]